MNVSVETARQVQYVINHYVFPLQFVLGFCGNALNLMVLLSDGMRSKTNILLASMALADIAFLIIMLPRSLLSYRWFRSQKTLHLFQLSQHVITGLANWWSVSSTWLILTVSIERLVAIKWPLKVKFYWRSWRLAITIVGIFILSFSLTFYHIIAFRVQKVTKLVNRSGDLHNATAYTSVPQYLGYIKVSMVIQTIVHIVSPLVVLTAVNASLVYFLRRQNKAMLHVNETNGPTQHKTSTRTKATQRRVTIMVIVIVTSFTLTSAPSALVFVWHYTRNFGIMSPLFYLVATIANSLVVTGKVLNFFLFCMSSANFRERLLRFVKKRAPDINSRLHEMSTFTRTRTQRLVSLQTSIRDNLEKNPLLKPPRQTRHGSVDGGLLAVTRQTGGLLVSRSAEAIPLGAAPRSTSASSTIDEKL